MRKKITGCKFLNTIVHAWCVVPLIFCACLISSQAWGQAPPDAGRMLQEMQKAAPPPKQAPQKPPIVTPAPPAPPMKKPAEEKLLVKGFTFSMDFPVVPESELQKVVKDYTNREVTFGELQEAAEKVTNYLRGKGYFLARAYIPQQEIKEGILKITIIIGKAEATDGKVVQVQGAHKRLRDSMIQGIMGEAVKPDEALKLSDVERGILLVNDLPETTAQADLTAGRTPGTTKIGLKVTEGRLITGSVGFDTFGSRYTGEARFLGNVNINDLTGQGDVLTLSGIQAGEPVFNVNKGHMWMLRAGWMTPVGYSGLKAGVSYTSLGYRIGKEFSALDENGTARIWAANALYPVLRSHDNNLYTTIMYEHRIFIDRANDATIDDKRVDALTLGINGNMTDSFGGGAFTAYGLAAVGGHLDLGRDSGNLLADQQTLKTNGDYWKLLYNGFRQQNIGTGFSLYGAVSGQYAGKNLDSSEQFILGGPNGVRAYPSGEAPGDNGVLVNAELRKDFPGTTPLGHVQALAFFDWGWIVQHKNGGNPSLKNSYGLSGAGAGINFSKASLYLVRAFWAATVGPNPGKSATGLDSDGKSFGNRFWVQGLVYF